MTDQRKLKIAMGLIKYGVGNGDITFSHYCNKDKIAVVAETLRVSEEELKEFIRSLAQELAEEPI